MSFLPSLNSAPARTLVPDESVGPKTNFRSPNTESSVYTLFVLNTMLLFFYEYHEVL